MLEQLQRLVCVSCRMEFAVPTGFYNARRADGTAFYCPVGHGQSFTETEAHRLRAQLQREQAERQRQETLRSIAETEAATARKTAKRETTKRRNLEAAIQAGVCPKCRRHFKDLQNHMEGEHP